MFCDIKNTFIRPCPKCRFEKCLKVGMDPKWVLNDEQKKIRFRKYFKNQEKVQIIHFLINFEKQFRITFPV